MRLPSAYQPATRWEPSTAAESPAPTRGALTRREAAGVTAPAGLAGAGELTLYREGRRPVRMALTAGQLGQVLRRWAAAARAGQGELLVGE